MHEIESMLWVKDGMLASSLTTYKHILLATKESYSLEIAPLDSYN